jgi:hypothetical protein
VPVLCDDRSMRRPRGVQITANELCLDLAGF